MNALENYIGDMKRVAGTNGGEYAGPCPHCGGTDRFRVWPADGETGAFWCRQCEASGDGIDYLREVEGMTFPEACRELHVEYKLDGDFDGGAPAAAPALKRKPRQKKRPPVPHEKPPSDKWQARARRVMERAENCLWTDEGAGARKWLHLRGFDETTLRLARIGYNPETQFEDGRAWGMDCDTVAVPDGIVIPWIIGEDIWKLNVRLGRESQAYWKEQGTPKKYSMVKGSRNALYRADMAIPGRPVVLTEGEFDALTVQQEGAGLAYAVATGSTGGARKLRWRVRLQRASAVLVAFDNDRAGEEAAAWWTDQLPNGRRCRPYRDDFNDLNEMLQDGESVKAWIEAGLSG